MTPELHDSASAQAARNKQLVIDFYRHVFDARNPEAVKDFVAEDYVQHSRHMPSGRAGLEALVRMLFPEGPIAVPPRMLRSPAFVVAEGDMVVIAGYLPQPDPDRPGELYDYYVFDSYRIREGKLAEHWSSINKIAPPRPRNPTSEP